MRVSQRRKSGSSKVCSELPLSSDHWWISLEKLPQRRVILQIECETRAGPKEYSPNKFDLEVEVVDRWKKLHALLCFTRFFSLSELPRNLTFLYSVSCSSTQYTYQNLFKLANGKLHGWMRCGLSFPAVKKSAQGNLLALSDNLFLYLYGVYGHNTDIWNPNVVFFSPTSECLFSQLCPVCCTIQCMAYIDTSKVLRVCPMDSLCGRSCRVGYRGV